MTFRRARRFGAAQDRPEAIALRNARCETVVARKRAVLSLETRERETEGTNETSVTTSLVEELPPVCSPPSIPPTRVLPHPASADFNPLIATSAERGSIAELPFAEPHLGITARYVFNYDSRHSVRAIQCKKEKGGGDENATIATFAKSRHVYFRVKSKKKTRDYLSPRLFAFRSDKFLRSAFQINLYFIKRRRETSFSHTVASVRTRDSSARFLDRATGTVGLIIRSWGSESLDARDATRRDLTIGIPVRIPSNRSPGQIAAPRNAIIIICAEVIPSAFTRRRRGGRDCCSHDESRAVKTR